MAIQIGESIGHYQVVEELGMGGNGRVLKVQHLITRRREAMKVLANGRPTSQEYAHRVLREIRLQASLDHPNIAAVLNAFWLEDDLVMIMELIEGVSLQKILENRRLNLDQSLKLIRQVLLALEHAHKNGVIHRDVSTANIVVSEDGRVKLTDFGLAKGSADLNATESGSMVGSPYYISPEQVRSTSAADQRSDIYSTGMVLYELLTGSRPFEADSTFLLMQAQVQMRPQPPIERNAALPQFINDAVLKAIAKNPRDRYQSAADFLAALEGNAAPPIAFPLPSKTEAPQAQPAPTVEPSHSFAVTISHEEVKPAPRPGPPVWRKVLANPVVATLLGILVVLAAVLPVLLYDFTADRPRFAPAQVAPLAVEVDAPDAPLIQPPLPAAAPPLVAGPRELPSAPQGNGGLVPARRSSASRQPKAGPAAPPPVVVWGEARSAVVATPSAVPAPSPAPVRVEAPVAPKLEEPPTLTASPVQSSIEPTMPQTGDTVRRRGLFRRISSGVKAINPLRKDSAVSPESAAPKP